MSKLALTPAGQSYVDNLQAIIKTAEKSRRDAQEALHLFLALPENNRYDSVEDAGELEDVLREQAGEDCEGSHNIGMDEYRQEFLVGEEKYVAILKCEYDRHDKTYYYIYSSDFSIEKVEA